MMSEQETSFFGAKIENMVRDAKTVADDLKFTNKIEDTINDLWGIIGIAMDSIVASCSKHESSDNENHFAPPSLDDHVDYEDDEPEVEGEIGEFSVDKLIAQSYTFGKSDEEIADDFRNDLKGTISHYAWLFVALGIALDHEGKREIVEVLKKKALELQVRTEEIKRRELKLNAKVV